MWVAEPQPERAMRGLTLFARRCGSVPIEILNAAVREIRPDLQRGDGQKA
jgi:hypothetical protein